MKLPLLVSVAHAGLRVPKEVEECCILSPEDIFADGDEGAAAIYQPLEQEVTSFTTTDVARAFVDVNRAEGDRRPDGVVKTQTCWGVPIYQPYPSERVIQAMLTRYYRPYHERLTRLAGTAVLLGVDCHTMAAIGPPIGPGAGRERPRVSLSNADGTCPSDWMEELVECFEDAFQCRVAVNDPFRGGYIIRSHAAELPWVQLELTRAPCCTAATKRAQTLKALRAWCHPSEGAQRGAAEGLRRVAHSKLESRKTHGHRRRVHARVVRRDGEVVTALPEEHGAGEVKCIQRPDRRGERLQRPG